MPLRVSFGIGTRWITHSFSTLPSTLTLDFPCVYSTSISAGSGASAFFFFRFFFLFGSIVRQLHTCRAPVRPGGIPPGLGRGAGFGLGFGRGAGEGNGAGCGIGTGRGLGCGLGRGCGSGCGLGSGSGEIVKSKSGPLRFRSFGNGLVFGFMGNGARTKGSGIAERRGAGVG